MLKLKQLLSRRKEPADAVAEQSPRPQKKRQPIGGVPIAVFGIGAVLVGLVALTCVAFLGIQERSALEASHAEALTQARGEAAAQRIVGRVAALVSVVEGIAGSPALVSAAQTEDAAAIEAAIRPAGALLAGFLGAQVVYPEQVEPDYTRHPALGYAALDLARRVEQGELPAVEVHLLDQEQQQIVVARPVRSGERLIGTLLVALEVAPLREWIGSVPAGMRVELRQSVDGRKPLVLASSGHAAGVGDTVSLSIQGSRWRLTLTTSAGESASAQWLTDAVPFAVVGAVQALLVLALALLMARLVRADLIRFLRYFVELYSGQRPSAAGLRLKEFRKAVKALDQYLHVHHGHVPEAGTDSTTHAAASSDALPDAMFLDRDAVVLEEFHEERADEPPARGQ